MSIEDIIHTLNLKDQRFEVLLEMLITIEASNRAISELILHDQSGADTNAFNALSDGFVHSQSKHRQTVIEGLYKKFGGLPGGLLSDDADE